MDIRIRWLQYPAAVAQSLGPDSSRPLSVRCTRAIFMAGVPSRASESTRNGNFSERADRALNLSGVFIAQHADLGRISCVCIRAVQSPR